LNVVGLYYFPFYNIAPTKVVIPTPIPIAITKPPTTINLSCFATSPKNINKLPSIIPIINSNKADQVFPQNSGAVTLYKSLLSVFNE